MSYRRPRVLFGSLLSVRFSSSACSVSRTGPDEHATLSTPLVFLARSSGIPAPTIAPIDPPAAAPAPAPPRAAAIGPATTRPGPGTAMVEPTATWRRARRRPHEYRATDAQAFCGFRAYLAVREMLLTGFIGHDRVNVLDRVVRVFQATEGPVCLGKVAIEAGDVMITG